MAEGRSRAEWGHTSSVLALLANCHRDPKRRRKPFTPSDFNPYTQPRRRTTGRKSHVSVEQLTRDILAVAEYKRKKGR